jgi:hypothetical protein
MNDEGFNWRNLEGGGRGLIWRFSGRTAAGHEKSAPNGQLAGGVTDSNMTQICYYSYIILQIKLKLQHSVQIGSADVSAELAASIFRTVQDLQEHTENGAASSSETPLTINLHDVISQKTWILTKNRCDKAVPTLKYGSGYEDILASADRLAFILKLGIRWGQSVLSFTPQPACPKGKISGSRWADVRLRPTANASNG